MDEFSVLRTGATNLTADETLDDFPLKPMVKPLYLHVNVPVVSASDTLDVTADFENVSGTTLQQTTIPQITALGHYVCPIFCDAPTLDALSVILNVTGTDVDLGAVKVWFSTSRTS